MPLSCLQKNLDGWFGGSPNPHDIAVTYHGRSDSQADISIESKKWALALLFASPGSLSNAGWPF
jgi:hypothetical protein